MSLKRKVTHYNSLVAAARALYSASIKEHDTTFYLLDFHEIKEWPRKKQYPYIDLIVSKHPP